MCAGRSKRVVLLVAVVLASLALSSDSALAQDADKYQFVFKPYSNRDWVGVRYRVSDGETWRAVKGAWLKVEENGAIPEPGKYRVEIVAEKDLNNWWVFRYNVETGRTWRMSGGNWIDMLTSPTTP